MRKKPVKSTSVGSDLKRRIVKKQQGGVASYINVNEPVLQYNNDGWIPMQDAFSEYNLPTKIKPHNEEPLPIAIKAVDTKEERAKTESERKPVKQNAFINGLRPIIEQTLKRRGLDTKWTDHLVAQAALESGWGKSESGKFNLSGIKGKGSEKNTKEYINGKMVNTRDSFRDYKDYNDWADNYINLLSNKRYGKAWTLSEDQFMPYIINAGYATDPNYISKYNKVLAEVKKYEDGGRIRRFQNAGIIARDNTRMPTVIAPKLKEQPQIPIPNQTYLSQAPSKEIIENNNLMQRRRELGNTITQFGTNLLDALKIGMSFANPAAGMALGLSDAGISAANGDYVSGGVQAGLEMLPYGISKLPAAKRIVKQGVKTYGTKAANAVEDIFPKTVDRFHTWNALDNMKHASVDDVFEAKRSRLLAQHPNYDFIDRSQMEKEFIGELSPKTYAEKVTPFPPARIKKINSTPPEVSSSSLTRWLVRKHPERKMDLYMNKEIYDRDASDIFSSFTDFDGIHLGTQKFNPKLTPKDKGFFDGVTDTKFNRGTNKAHEFDHYVSVPTRKEAEELERLLGNVGKDFEGYYNMYNQTEKKARLGQFKDLFLLKGKTPISKSQTRTAIKMYTHPNYFGTFDNFTGLIGPLKKVDPTELSDFMNKTSLKNGGIL